MDKIYISNHIKSEILDVCGLPTTRSYNLEGNTSLGNLGYKDSIHGRMLENRLQEIAKQYNTGELILSGVISNDFTVSQCIKLIIK